MTPVFVASDVLGLLLHVCSSAGVDVCLQSLLISPLCLLDVSSQSWSGSVVCFREEQL